MQRYDAVFEGGGVKGIGLVGAVAVLEEAGHRPENLAGASAGAIVASLLAAGYTAAELRQILMDLDFNDFTDRSTVGAIPVAGPIVSVLSSLGLYKGDFFLQWIRGLLAARGKRTFADLIIPEYQDDPRYRFRLNVVASDISRGRLLILPNDIVAYGTRPEDLEIALAVRMSMSIPYFFRPVELRTPEGVSRVVDGGLLSNFPVDIFDSPGTPEWPTFGFHLAAPQAPGAIRHRADGVISVFAAMFETMMGAHDARYLDTHQFVRTILIDTLGVGTTDFALTAEKKTALYESGVAGARDFLARWDFDSYKAAFRSGSPPPRRRRV